jgi:SAM-dependent methyltransferase
VTRADAVPPMVLGQAVEEPPAANAAQVEAWNGDQGLHWAEHAERYERTTRRHWERLREAAGVTTDTAAVDVGCGTGTSTLEVGRLAPSGSVLGIDISAPMLHRARARTAEAGLTNVEFVLGDAQVHPFGASRFDIALSCFGSMFFDDPVRAFRNIGQSLRPGGRLALLVWRDLPRNEWLVEIRAALAVGRELPMPPPDAPSPFSLANPARVGALLRTTGFDDVNLEPVDEPVDLGSDADDAFAFARTLGFTRGLTDDLSPADRELALDQLHRTLHAHAGRDGVLLASAAWLVTATHGH